MGLGQKRTFTGTITKERVATGSKSDRETFVFQVDNEEHLPYPIHMRDGNPLRDPRLEKFVGKSVKLEGTLGSGVWTIFVDKIDDITVIGGQKPPARRPAGPKL